jgi:hypothetical protein
MSNAPTGSATKLCRDCVFAKPTPWWDAAGWYGRRYEFAKCQRAEALHRAASVRLTDGAYEKAEQHFCTTARDASCGMCLPEARWFEPKRPCAKPVSAS